MEGHKQRGVKYCFFVKDSQIVLSFTSDEMVCWYVNNPMEKWIKLFSVEKPIIPLSGFNNQLTGLIIDEQVRIFDDKLLFELSDNKEILNKIFKS